MSSYQANESRHRSAQEVGRKAARGLSPLREASVSSKGKGAEEGADWAWEPGSVRPEEVVEASSAGGRASVRRGGARVVVVAVVAPPAGSPPLPLLLAGGQAEVPPSLPVSTFIRLRLSRVKLKGRSVRLEDRGNSHGKACQVRVWVDCERDIWAGELCQIGRPIAYWVAQGDLV